MFHGDPCWGYDTLILTTMFEHQKKLLSILESYLLVGIFLKTTGGSMVRVRYLKTSFSNAHFSYLRTFSNFSFSFFFCVCAENMFSQSSKELLGMKHQEQELDSTSQSTSQNNPTKGPQLTLSPTSCVASLADAPTNSSSSSWNTCGQKRLSIPTTGKGKGKKKK